MAKKRMVSNQIVDSDAFLDMPLSAQALYLHLLVRADDEGFSNGFKKVMRMIRASDDDLKILIAKNFIIMFESGVLVIKHWLIHNTIRQDRLIPTVHEEEKRQISTKNNGSYTLKSSDNFQNVSHVSVTCQSDDRIEENRLDKISIDKNSKEKTSKEKVKHYYGEFKHVLITDEELEKLKEDFPRDYKQMIKNLDEYLEIKNVSYKNHYLVMRKWKSKEKKQDKNLDKKDVKIEWLEEYDI